MRVLDLGAAIVHYRDRVGLDLVSWDESRAYLRAADEFDRHSLVLREAQEPGWT